MSPSTEVKIDDLLKRITFNPEILGGKAIIDGSTIQFLQCAETTTGSKKPPALADGLLPT